MGRVFMTGGGGTDTSAVTALPADVLTNHKFIDSEGDEVDGTMANNGAVHQTLDGGASYTIPEGYHDGTGTVTAKPLSDQTPGNANQADIFSGKTAWVNGQKVTGNMPNNNAVSLTVARNGSVTVPKGYHNGSGKVTGPTMTDKVAATHNPTATAHQIIPAGCYTTGAQTIAAVTQTNLVAGNIKSGVTVTVKGGTETIFTVNGSLDTTARWG